MQNPPYPPNQPNPGDQQPTEPFASPPYGAPQQPYPQQPYPPQQPTYPQPGYPQQPQGYPQVGYPQQTGYPPPGGQPPKKSNTALIIIGSIVGVLVLICGTCGILTFVTANRAANDIRSAISTVAPTLTAAAATQSAAETAIAAPGGSTGRSTGTVPAGPHHAAGETVVINSDFTATLNSVKTDPGSGFSKAKDGDTFLIVDVTIKNTSNSEQTIAGTFDFTLRDSSGQEIPASFVADVKLPSGTIPAGGQLNGQLAYEVPTTSQAYTLSFAPDLLNSDQVAIWDVKS